jgi:hypothetical protein
LRLGLDGFGDVDGDTLQEAADELVTRLLSISMVIRSGGVGPLCSEGCPGLAVLDFLWQLGELAAAGGDPRELLFGPNPLTAA